MNKLNIKACPLCHGTQLKRMMTCTDFYATGEQFQLFQCQECSFLFTQDFPVESEIGRYYETPDYISHSDTKKGLMNGLYHLVRKRMLNHKAKLVERFTRKTSGKILDIGTGTGYFTHTMQQRGWEVEAIEKNAQARAFAKKHFNLDVKEDSELNQLPGEEFGAITLWHVMEHLENLNDTWDQLYNLLADDGVLIIAVPNCDSYDAQKYKDHWAAYDVPRHLWHFSPDTMQKLGTRHSFLLTAHLPMPFDAFYVSILSEKFRKSSFPFIRGMITGGFAWFSALASKERSSSMIYIFRKIRNEK